MYAPTGAITARTARLTRRDFVVRSAWCASALCGSACTSWTFPVPRLSLSGQASVVLPLVMSASGHTLIYGEVMGRVGVWFALDTGAPVTVLFDGPRTAALKLDSSGARKLGRADDIASPIGVIQPGFDIAFGGHLKLSGLTAVVVPESTLPCIGLNDDIGIGGVVGADLMRQLITQIDSEAGQVILQRPADFHMPPGYVSVPMEIDRSGFLIVRAGVRSANPHLPRTLRLLVDTGLPVELAFQLTNQEAIATVAPDAIGGSGCGIGGVRRYWRDSQALELSIASLAVTVSESVYEVGSFDFDCLIGSSLLYRHRPIVDMPDRRLLLRRQSKEAKPRVGASVT
jgi:hypothetical protein